ncbi:MAG: hypothetical protein A2W22_03075 [Candidatus Levybacteria bacterium RBG_16_35_11]|nr:MAG: hypothetical protein A2W22_03075 [Candidatus Levybacteria bacterium RBG_16_35_11]
MNKIFNHPTYRFFYQLLWLYVLMSFVLSGCAAANVYPSHVLPEVGDVWGLYYGSARYIVDGAINFEPFSAIYESPDKIFYVFARPIANGWGWVVAKSNVILSEIKFDSGNYACCSTWSNLRTWMENNHWTILSGGLTTQLRLIASSISEVNLAPIFLFPASLDSIYQEYENIGGTIDG